LRSVRVNRRSKEKARQKTMKKAVMYGAGNIGRGFIGQVFHDSGYEVVFIEVNKPVVEALNQKKCYPLRVVSEERTFEVTIDNVRAVDGTDSTAVADEIASADIMATAVGVNVLPRIAPNIAAGIIKRPEVTEKPLNIIVCENLIDAGHALKDMLKPFMTDVSLLHNVGFVEASIGRMVPVMTAEMQEGDNLRQWVEPYCELPLDAQGFKGGIPDLKYIKTFSPFRFYEERKLYIHNLGHAMAAYLGYLKGYDMIWQAAGDTGIAAKTREAMTTSALALSGSYGVPFAELKEHIDDLLSRFANRALGDTVARVGRDPMRKLKPGDRFAGAIALCNRENFDPSPILKGMAAALYFIREDDEPSLEMQKALAQSDISGFLTGYCNLSAEDAKTCAVYYGDKAGLCS